MRRSGARRVSRRSSGDLAWAREFLERLTRILVYSGHSPRGLAREFRSICEGLKEPRSQWDATELHYAFDLPHVITLWYTDPQYVDSHGVPLPLPLHASGPSLSALMESALPGADAARVIQSLRRLGAVRKQGSRYLPTGRYLAYNQQRTAALAHGLHALLGMLRTVEHNICNPDGETVLERAAMNPRFPVRGLPAFHKRLKALATEFLWSIDGDMRRREVRGRNGPTTRLGVGIFAFEDPLVTGTRRAKPVLSKRSRIAARKVRR